MSAGVGRPISGAGNSAYHYGNQGLQSASNGTTGFNRNPPISSLASSSSTRNGLGAQRAVASSAAGLSMNSKSTSRLKVDEALKNLDDDQKVAVHADVDGPVIVVAGPGSGKTSMLTARIGYMVEYHNIKPRNILAITFTRSGAGEMKSRLQRMLGPDGDKVTAKTFHALAKGICEMYIESVHASRFLDLQGVIAVRGGDDAVHNDGGGASTEVDSSDATASSSGIAAGGGQHGPTSHLNRRGGHQQAGQLPVLGLADPDSIMLTSSFELLMDTEAKILAEQIAFELRKAEFEEFRRRLIRGEASAIAEFVALFEARDYRGGSGHHQYGSNNKAAAAGAAGQQQHQQQQQRPRRRIDEMSLPVLWLDEEKAAYVMRVLLFNGTIIPVCPTVYSPLGENGKVTVDAGRAHAGGGGGYGSGYGSGYGAGSSSAPSTNGYRDRGFSPSTASGKKNAALPLSDEERDVKQFLQSQVKALQWQGHSLHQHWCHIRMAGGTADECEGHALQQRDHDLLQAVKFGRLYSLQCLQSNRLDFTDMIRYATLILTSCDEARARTRRRWTHVLVDEFQDTSPSQFAFLMSIVACIHGSGAEAANANSGFASAADASTSVAGHHNSAAAAAQAIPSSTTIDLVDLDAMDIEVLDDGTIISHGGGTAAASGVGNGGGALYASSSSSTAIAAASARRSSSGSYAAGAGSSSSSGVYPRKGPALTVVGDHRQAIYAFQGGDRDSFAYIQRTWPHSKLMPLRKNYRSTGNIVKSFNAVISPAPPMPGVPSDPSIPTKADGPEIIILEGRNVECEAHFVVMEIKRLIEVQKVEPRDIAIQSRLNATLGQYEQVFRQVGIPYCKLGQQQNIRPIRVLLAALRVIADDGADEALKKLVEKDKKRLSPHTWNLARKLMMHGENADLSTVDLGFVSDGFGGQLGYGSGGSSYQHFGGRKMSLLTALYTLHERFVQRDKDGLRPDGWWLKKNRDKSKALAAKRSRTSGAGAGNVSYYHPVGPDDEDAHPLDNVRLRYDMEHFVESPVSSTTALLGHISNLRRHCGSWNFGTFLARCIETFVKHCGNPRAARRPRDVILAKGVHPIKVGCPGGVCAGQQLTQLQLPEAKSLIDRVLEVAAAFVSAADSATSGNANTNSNSGAGGGRYGGAGASARGSSGGGDVLWPNPSNVYRMDEWGVDPEVASQYKRDVVNAKALVPGQTMLQFGLPKSSAAPASAVRPAIVAQPQVAPVSPATEFATSNMAKEAEEWSSKLDPIRFPSGQLNATVAKFVRQGYLVTIKAFADYLEGILTDEGHVLNSSGDGASPQDGSTNQNAVVLLTMHKGKGLQWPYTFLIKCVDGTVPMLDQRMQEEDTYHEYISRLSAFNRDDDDEGGDGGTGADDADAPDPEMPESTQRAAHAASTAATSAMVEHVSQVRFPHEQPINERLERFETSLEEERRLFFVACSRPERQLYVCYPRSQIGKDGEEDLSPSRFIYDLTSTWTEQSTSSGSRSRSSGGAGARMMHQAPLVRRLIQDDTVSPATEHRNAAMPAASGTAASSGSAAGGHSAAAAVVLVGARSAPPANVRAPPPAATFGFGVNAPAAPADDVDTGEDAENDPAPSSSQPEAERDDHLQAVHHNITDTAPAAAAAASAATAAPAPGPAATRMPHQQPQPPGSTVLQAPPPPLPLPASSVASHPQAARATGASSAPSSIGRPVMMPFRPQATAVTTAPAASAPAAAISVPTPLPSARQAAATGSSSSAASAALPATGTSATAGSGYSVEELQRKKLNVPLPNQILPTDAPDVVARKQRSEQIRQATIDKNIAALLVDAGRG